MHCFYRGHCCKLATLLNMLSSLYKDIIIIIISIIIIITKYETYLFLKSDGGCNGRVLFIFRSNKFNLRCGFFDPAYKKRKAKAALITISPLSV